MHTKLLVTTALCTVALAACGDDGEPNSSSEDAREPVLATQDAKNVPLDTPSDEVEEQFGAPAGTQVVRAGKRTGEIEGETRTFPAEDFECWLYYGEDPGFGWQLCFGEDGELEFLNTTSEPPEVLAEGPIVEAPTPKPRKPDEDAQQGTGPPPELPAPGGSGETPELPVPQS